MIIFVSRALFFGFHENSFLLIDCFSVSVFVNFLGRTLCWIVEQNYRVMIFSTKNLATLLVIIHSLF